MTFKAENNDKYHASRSRNLHRLLQAGVPERIARGDRDFWILVQEGEELGGVGWNVDWISNQEAEDLYSLLSEFFGNESDLGWDLLDRLRRKLGGRLPKD